MQRKRQGSSAANRHAPKTANALSRRETVLHCTHRTKLGTASAICTTVISAEPHADAAPKRRQEIRPNGLRGRRQHTRTDCVPQSPILCGTKEYQKRLKRRAIKPCFLRKISVPRRNIRGGDNSPGEHLRSLHKYISVRNSSVGYNRDDVPCPERFQKAPHRFGNTLTVNGKYSHSKARVRCVILHRRKRSDRKLQEISDSIRNSAAVPAPRETVYGNHGVSSVPSCKNAHISAHSGGSSREKPSRCSIS